ncbi:hypothetical protein quinque_004341 [Culex quinquefasciatus]
MFPDGSTAVELVNSLQRKMPIRPSSSLFSPSCPNIQRSMSVLSQTVAGAKQFSALPLIVQREINYDRAVQLAAADSTSSNFTTSPEATKSLKESLREPRLRKTKLTRSNKIFQRKLILWPLQQSVANTLFPGGSTATKQSISLQQISLLQGRHADGAGRGRFGKSFTSDCGFRWNLCRKGKVKLQREDVAFYSAAAAEAAPPPGGIDVSFSRLEAIHSLTGLALQFVVHLGDTDRVKIFSGLWIPLAFMP